MGLVERFSKLRSRWSRNFPPNLARLMLLGCAALWGGSYLLAKFAMEAIPPNADGSAHDRRLPVHAGLVP